MQCPLSFICHHGDPPNLYPQLHLFFPSYFLFYALEMFSSRANTLLVRIQISLLDVRSAANETGGRDVASVLYVQEKRRKNCTEHPGAVAEMATRCLKRRGSRGEKNHTKKPFDFKCVSKRFHRTSEKASRLRHHVGLHSVLPDWNGWEYVNRLHV